MTDYVNRQVESSTPSDQQQRRPKVRRWRGTERRWRLVERRRCRLSLSESDMQYSFKYWGALFCIHRRTVMQSLNYIRSGTSSQWRSVCNRLDRSWSNFFILLTRRAAALSIRCSLSVSNDCRTCLSWHRQKKQDIGRKSGFLHTLCICHSRWLQRVHGTVCH